MNKKISTVRRGTIIFLSLLTVLVISLLIYGYDSMHDPEKVKARLYACGKFGDRHMLIDKQYLLFWQSDLSRCELLGEKYRRRTRGQRL